MGRGVVWVEKQRDKRDNVDLKPSCNTRFLSNHVGLSQPKELLWKRSSKRMIKTRVAMSLNKMIKKWATLLNPVKLFPMSASVAKVSQSPLSGSNCRKVATHSVTEYPVNNKVKLEHILSEGAVNIEYGNIENGNIEFCQESGELKVMCNMLGTNFFG